VWNGGIPDIRLFDGEGALLKRWRSKHLPLGILSQPQLDLTTEPHTYAERANLIMCSDGLLEARNAKGETFGAARLALACAGLSAGEAMARTTQRFEEFLAGADCHDDVSLAIVDLDPAITVNLPAPSQGVVDLSDVAGEAQWRYALSLGAEELRSLHTVPLIMGFIAQIKPLANAHADIFLILTELFVNALDHGLLGLSSDVKNGPEGMERYLNERASRLGQLMAGRIDIELAGYDLGARTVLRIRVADSGNGFDFEPRAVADSNLPSGRGIELVRSLAVSLKFFGNGSTAEACYLPRIEN
jgi:hypothetical protein